MKTRVEPDLMIEHSFTLQWFGSYSNFITHRNMRMPTFQPIARKRVVSTGMMVKRASSGLEFKQLAVAFQRGGKDGLISLLTEKKNTDNKVRVANKKSVLNSLTNYFEKISETWCKQVEHTYNCLSAALLFILSHVKRKITRFSFTFKVKNFSTCFLFISAVKNVQLCNTFVRTGKTLVYFEASTPVP